MSISLQMIKRYRKAEYVQRDVGFDNTQVILCEALHYSSLHKNVFFSECVRMRNAAYILFNMWNSISSLTPDNIFIFKSDVVWLFEKSLTIFRVICGFLLGG